MEPSDDFGRFLQQETERTICRDVQRDTPGWHRMWAVIAAKYGDPACLNDGEAWQYMGTISWDGGATWVHQFRHRCLPATGNREYHDVPAMTADFEGTA